MDRHIAKSKGLRGTVSVPGDKSISHRALMIAALANGQSEIAGLLDAADPTSTRRCLNGLGVDPKQAAITAVSRRGPWAMSNMKAFKLAMPNKFFADRGLLALSGYGS